MTLQQGRHQESYFINALWQHGGIIRSFYNQMIRQMMLTVCRLCLNTANHLLHVHTTVQ